MNLKKLVHKKRAVSPILAAVLLIGLAISAGAVLFIVVLPMISAPGGSIVIDNSSEFPTSTSVKIALRNEASEGITITAIEVKVSNGTTSEVATLQGFTSFTINSGSSKINTYSFTLATITTPTTGNFTVTYGDGEIVTSANLNF